MLTDRVESQVKRYLVWVYEERLRTVIRVLAQFIRFGGTYESESHVIFSHAANLGGSGLWPHQIHQELILEGEPRISWILPSLCVDLQINKRWEFALFTNLFLFPNQHQSIRPARWELPELMKTQKRYQLELLILTSFLLKTVKLKILLTRMREDN